MKTLVVCRSKKRINKKFLERWLAAVVPRLKKVRALREKKRLQGDLTIVFVDGKEMKTLNSQFRGKTYATDILSFDGEDGSLGELVLCLPRLEKQAKEHGLTIQLEMGYLIIHGLLHLLGYDHEISDVESEKMFKIQDEVFDFLCDHPRLWRS